MAKTAEQSFKERLDRALNQRMYLLDSRREESNYVFQVEGSTGTPYNVTISDNLKCTCIDFKKRKKVCKHIMFVICRVYKQNLVSDDPDVNMLHVFEGTEGLEASSLSLTKTIITGECSICYEDIDNGEKCRVCVGTFHKGCIKVWIKQKSNCPMCRSIW